MAYFRDKQHFTHNQTMNDYNLQNSQYETNNFVLKAIFYEIKKTHTQMEAKINRCICELLIAENSILKIKFQSL